MNHTNIKWETTQKKVTELIPQDTNPRKISEKQMKDLQKSLKDFNLVEIPVIDTDNTIIAGHQRVQALINLGRGDETIDVRIPNRALTTRERERYLIASNALGGEWDVTKLKIFESDFLLDIGFDEYELTSLWDKQDTNPLTERKEKNIGNKVTNILSVMKDRGVVRYADKGNVGNKSSSRPESYKIVYPNDIVANSMNLVIGSVGISRELGVTSSVYLIYRGSHQNMDIEYFHYLFKTKQFQKHLGLYGRGIMELRESVKHQDIKTQLVPNPPKETQENIVSFLDIKTSNIDSLFAKKKKMIELLQEKRSSVITHAVTKGLDHDVKMKDSGVDWIGEMPESWMLNKLKFLSIVRASNIDKKSKDSEVPVSVCNYTDVYYNEKILSDNVFLSATATIDQIKNFTVDVGDILMTKDSETPDDIGVPAINNLSSSFVSGYHLYHLKPNNKINNEYLFRFIQSENVKGYFLTRSYGVTRYGLSSYPLKNIEILLPNEIGQDKIIEYLNKETKKIDSTISKVKQQIKLLSEYKSSLIYHVVTGKIEI